MSGNYRDLLDAVLIIAAVAVPAFLLWAAVAAWIDRRNRREFGDYFADDDPARWMCDETSVDYLADDVDPNGRNAAARDHDYAHGYPSADTTQRNGGTP